MLSVMQEESISPSQNPKPVWLQSVFSPPLPDPGRDEEVRTFRLSSFGGLQAGVCIHIVDLHKNTKNILNVVCTDNAKESIKLKT